MWVWLESFTRARVQVLVEVHHYVPVGGWVGALEDFVDGQSELRKGFLFVNFDLF